MMSERPDLTQMLLEQIWLLCDEPAYAEQEECFMLFGDGELIRVVRGKQIASERIEPPASWLVEGLPETPAAFQQRQGVGAITINLANARRLRYMTEKFFKKDTQR